MSLYRYLPAFGILGPIEERRIRRRELTGHDFERTVDCGD